MIRVLILILALINVAFAGNIENAFKKRNFKRITEIYRDNPAAPYTPKQLIYISFSLRKMEFYRQDIKLSARLIKEKFKSDHQRLIKQIKEAQTVDGEEYPNGLKILYWNMFIDYGKIIESYEDESELIEKDHKQFLLFSKILSELEFRESKADKFSDRLLTHIAHLKNKVYKFSSSLNLSYISWQHEAYLDGNGQITNLVITNKGLCAGGDIGYENYRWHYYVDACAFAGSGGVANVQTTGATYQQANVPAYGAKISPGVSMIVSATKSRIGLRLPVIYSVQSLTAPEDTSYKIVQRSPLNFVTSLYSRWQFNKWYFQTEFGKYVNKEQTFWGLGLGRNF